jgi:peptidoglycan hydrolase-like protein with peptidoglycan-binding domain
MPRRAARPLRAPRREDSSRVRRLLRWLAPSRPADTIAVVVAACGAAAVLANALLLQPVPKAAKPFVTAPAKPAAPSERQTTSVKRTVPAAPAPIAVAPPPPQRPDTAAVRPRSDLVFNMQRELAQLGFYDGAADGLLGPRTEQAIRDFEKSQGLKISGEPSATLLDVMRRARAKPETTGSVTPAEARPSTRVLAVQRVLARLGYGPVKLNGVPDAATRSAITQFERDRGLTRSGEVSERLLAELKTVTGGPVE